jgi:hypothetical protein
VQFFHQEAVETETICTEVAITVGHILTTKIDIRLFNFLRSIGRKTIKLLLGNLIINLERQSQLVTFFV